MSNSTQKTASLPNYTPEEAAIWSQIPSVQLISYLQSWLSLKLRLPKTNETLKIQEKGIHINSNSQSKSNNSPYPDLSAHITTANQKEYVQ